MKRYLVTKTVQRHTGERVYTNKGTLADLREIYAYTLEKGASWAHEKGNRKINRQPKTIGSLITNLFNAENNAAANGNSGADFTFRELTSDGSDLWISDDDFTGSDFDFRDFKRSDEVAA